ncbi:unnamed protein product, partial [marine sediment metagenome]
NAPKEAIAKPIIFFLLNFSLKTTRAIIVISMGLIKQSENTGIDGPIKLIAE